MCRQLADQAIQKKSLVRSAFSFLSTRYMHRSQTETGSIVGNIGSSDNSLLVHQYQDLQQFFLGLKEPAWFQVLHPLIFYLLLYWLSESIGQSLLFEAYRGFKKRKQPQSIQLEM